MSLAFLGGACAGAAPSNPDAWHPPGGSGGSTDARPLLDLAPPPPPSCGTSADDLCEDFPAEPQIDPGVTGDPGSQFSGDPPTSGGPCVMEPEDGAMYPMNWARPRIRWTGATAGTLTKLIFECPREKNPLVAYTTQSEYKIPKAIWDSMRTRINDSGQTGLSSWVTVTVWPKGGGASQTKFLIAPVEASGSMVFWAARGSALWSDPKDPPNDSTSYLLGFAVGDEGTAQALTVTDVKQTTIDDGGKSRSIRCIGCHTSTPDGKHVAFTDHWAWPNAIASVEPGRTGEMFPEMTAGGAQAVAMNWQGVMTFSPGHWAPGDFTMVSTLSNPKPTEPWSNGSAEPAKLIWIDVAAPQPFQMDQSIGRAVPKEGVHYGFIARTGDPHIGAATPAWSKSGTTIAYASTEGGNKDGRLEQGATDIYLVPYNNRAGGEATPLAGAATTEYEEYYPAWSPDDSLIAFNRVPRGELMYKNLAESTEIFVVPSEGGEAVRLAANDPPKCSGKSSPGVHNHWPKWSPEVKAYGQRHYYWLVFSSNRMGLPDQTSPTGKTAKTAQLYMTGVITDETGIHAFPAVYLWNQPTDSINTTPAWDTFTIPVVQ